MFIPVLSQSCSHSDSVFILMLSQFCYCSDPVPTLIHRFRFCILFSQSGKPDHRLWMLRTLTQAFLHPYHIVPVIKFIGALMKFSHHFVTLMSMEVHTVFGQINILFLIWISDAGIYTDYVLSEQRLFQRYI